MTLKKIKFSYKDILYKSKRVATLGLMLVLCGGAIITSNIKETSDIPVHDGEVLVDSLSVEENNNKIDKTKDFETTRAEIELERNNLISTLEGKEKDRILNYMETELAIESIIKSKGLPASLVIITEQTISVTVDKQELDTSTVAKICDIVMRETGKPAEKIIIQSKY